MSSILLVEDLFSGYGELPVLDGVRVEVGRGEIVSVVGANGAGKTTLLLTISGHLRAHAGRVTFDGRDITNVPAHSAAECSVTRVIASLRVLHSRPPTDRASLTVSLPLMGLLTPGATRRLDQSS